MRIFLNALGASTASGLTYLRNVVPELAARKNVETILAASSRVQAEFTAFENVRPASIPDLQGTARRFWFEQTSLPDLIRPAEADVLISTGNFALRRSPVPQILLSGNSLYTSRDFSRDLLSRHEYRLWLDNRIKASFARKSIFWADCTIAPTRAFADELSRWTRKSVRAIHHGFNAGIFFSDSTPLPSDAQRELDDADDALKLLYVSHYNYFRNFETLFRALPLIREKIAPRNVRLLLTCKLRPGENPGAYRTEPASRLIKRLGLESEVVQLGAIPYRQLHHLYRSCNLYVSPSYAETFAHPLVEAQACGLPIVASDLPVHREVCGDRALYFDCFSPSQLADQVIKAAMFSNAARHSIPQTVRFSWREHVDKLLEVANSLVTKSFATAA